jgi:hypothetical protein
MPHVVTNGKRVTRIVKSGISLIGDGARGKTKYTLKGNDALPTS